MFDNQANVHGATDIALARTENNIKRIVWRAYLSLAHLPPDRTEPNQNEIVFLSATCEE